MGYVNLLTLYRKSTLNCIYYIVFLSVTYLCLPTHVFAFTDEGHSANLTMTLTPPLYQVSLAPGAKWSSTLRFSNGNTYPLTVFVSVLNFRGASGGASGIELYPRSNFFTESPYELASWLTYPSGALTIPAGETMNIPFTIVVPENAEPGGHYAAMIVGTEPLDTSGAADLSVSSAISSLVMVRVAGDVVEEGFIHDFFAEHWLAQSQEGVFHLYFENNGNIHIEPSGDIVIYNMFGKERGRIAIDESNTLGNVLPHSSKIFSFDWKGEQNFFDIGLYHARARLIYGENNNKTAYQSAYFLVFPWVPACSILGFLAVFFLFVRRYVTQYVARAIQLEQKRPGHKIKEHNDVVPSRKPRRVTFAMLQLPISGRNRSRDRLSFIVFLTAVILSAMLIVWYFFEVFQDERQFQVTTNRNPHEQLLK